MKNKPAAIGILVCTACAEPFDMDKHDLVEFRIAAMKHSQRELSASVWGKGLCHTAHPSFQWTQDGQVNADIVAPLQDGAAEANLEVRSQDGAVRQGILSLETELEPFEVERTLVNVDDLSIEARRGLDESPFEGGIDAGQALRIRALVDDSVDLQWMTAFGHGTFLELDPQTVDFFPEDIVFEDGELVERKALDYSQYQLLALALDGRGGNQWNWLGVETERELGLWSGGWAVPQPVDGSNTGLLAVTL